MSTFTKVLLMAAVPVAIVGIGAFAFLDVSGWGQANESAPPLRPLSINTARKAAKSGCCCAAKGKACNCGPNCGSHQAATAQPTSPASAAQAVGLLGAPMGPLMAPALLPATPPPAKVGSAAPATRSTPTP